MVAGVNTIVYTPDGTDSVITSNEVQGNTIVVNGQKIRSLDGTAAAQITASSTYTQGQLLRDVIWNGKHVGTIHFAASVAQGNIVLTNSDDSIQQGWMAGSTNAPQGFFFYQKTGTPLSQ